LANQYNTKFVWGCTLGLWIFGDSGKHKVLANSRADTCITPEILRIAHNNILKRAEGGMIDLTTLPIHKQLILLALHQELSKSSKPYVALQRTHESYKACCRDFGLSSCRRKEFKTNLQSLLKENLVILKMDNGKFLIGSERSSERMIKMIMEGQQLRAIRFSDLSPYAKSTSGF